MEEANFKFPAAADQATLIKQDTVSENSESNIVDTIFEAQIAIGDLTPSNGVITTGSSSCSFLIRLESSADFLGGVGFIIGEEC